VENGKVSRAGNLPIPTPNSRVKHAQFRVSCVLALMSHTILLLARHREIGSWKSDRAGCIYYNATIEVVKLLNRCE